MEGDNKNENSCPGYPRPVSHGKFARPKSSGNNGTDIIGFCLKKIDTQWWSPLAYDCNANEADESLEDIVAKGDLAKYLVEVDRPKPSNPTPYDRDPVSDYPDTTDTPKVTPRRSTLQATR
ncbi:hypothetical protein BD777DRAFT_125331 [Yarrowia lipolytica]|nr:hypothetical protein BD777DRAFT_125331 [Yarrowia lipolytica]